MSEVVGSGVQFGNTREEFWKYSRRILVTSRRILAILEKNFNNNQEFWQQTRRIFAILEKNFNNNQEEFWQQTRRILVNIQACAFQAPTATTLAETAAKFGAKNASLLLCTQFRCSISLITLAVCVSFPTPPTALHLVDMCAFFFL